MKKEIADLWVADLRTNPKQCRMRLGNDEVGHCCLGRLHVVLGIDTVDFQYLTAEAMDLAGVRTSSGIFNGTSLAFMNDGGSTFSTIADVIEENWEVL